MSSTLATWPLFGVPMLSSAESTQKGIYDFPQGRPRTLKILPLDIRGRPIRPASEQRQEESDLGAVRHKAPPPDVARVLSSLALVAALILSLMLQAFLGP